MDRRIIKHKKDINYLEKQSCIDRCRTLNNEYKKTNNPVLGLIRVNFILDISYSMGNNKEKLIKNQNRLICDIKEKFINRNLLFSSYIFNEDIFKIVCDKPLSSRHFISNETLRCNSNTALLDAVGESIKDNDFYERRNKSHKNITIIFTDGQENCSVNYSLDKITRMINDRVIKDNRLFIMLFFGDDSELTVNDFLNLNIYRLYSQYNMRAIYTEVNKILDDFAKLPLGKQTKYISPVEIKRLT
jgi:hypothetical protein